MRWTRAGAWSLAAAAIAALIYGATLAPTVGAGDSAEFILAADSLGVPHPPGYPLWILLARLAALLPFGAVAWRVNALSAVVSAAAVGLFYLLAVRVGLPRRGAALAAAFFAASTIVWRSAVEAEVYPLATLFFVLLCLLALRARSVDTRSARSDAAFFFALGLAALVHQTLAIPGAVLALWVLKRDPRLSRVAASAAWGALGLSILFVIPVRTAAGPAFLWDQSSGLADTIGHLLRRNYGVLQQNPFRLDRIAADLAGMGFSVGLAVGIPAAILAAAGLIDLRSKTPEAGREAPALGPVLVAAVALPVALAALLVFTPDAEHFAQVEPFLAPLVAVLCLAAGFGAEAAFRRAPAGWRTGVAALLASLALVTLASHYRDCDRSGFRLAERYGRDLLRNLPSGSTLVLDGDNETFLTAYATRVEHLRPDITLIHRRGYIFGDPYGLRGVPRSRWVEVAHRVDLERLKTATRPIYYATPPADLESAGVTFVPAGLVQRAMFSGGERDARRASARTVEAVTVWMPPADWPRSTDLLPGEPARYDYVTRKLAVSYSDAAARSLWAQGRLDEAFPWFLDAAAVGFDNAGARLNLATAAAAVGKPDLALSEFLAARSIAPNDPGPAERLAVFLSAAGRHRDAALWFERAYQAGPAPSRASDAARAWALAGDEERARQWRERAG